MVVGFSFSQQQKAKYYHFRSELTWGVEAVNNSLKVTQLT